MNDREARDLERLRTRRRRRRAWFWVSNSTPSDFAAWYEERGNTVANQWWTCDPDAQEGDVVFSYVTKPTSAIVAVKVIASSARQLAPGDHPQFDRDGEPAWVCDWRFVGLLDKPFSFKALKADAIAQQEHGVKTSFNGRSFACSPEAFSAVTAKILRNER